MPGFLLPGLLTAGLVAALVSAFSGKDDDNHEPQPSTNSSSRSSDTTRQPNQSPPSSYSRDSYVRDQKAGKRHLTSDNGRSLDDSKHTSPHARASSRTQTSPSVPSRFQTTAATVARDQGYHDSNLNLSPAVQPPQPASTPAYAYHQPSPVLADLSEAESEIEYIEDDDIGKELRDRARRHGREMRDARAQAKSARKGGDHLAERYYKQVAVARKSAMDELNTKAAKIIFHHKNKGRKEGTVDLHGLHVQEAIQYAKQELQSASLKDGAIVRFIVGKGLHAKDRRAKIRPALEKLCTERGLIHSLNPRNAGVLIVQLD